MNFNLPNIWKKLQTFRGLLSLSILVLGLAVSVILVTERQEIRKEALERCTLQGHDSCGVSGCYIEKRHKDFDEWRKYIGQGVCELWKCPKEDVPPGCEKKGTPDTTKPVCGVIIEPEGEEKNLVQNPGFEDGLKNWTIISGNPKKQNEWKRGGKWAIRGTNYKIEQDVRGVTQGELYKLSIWAKAEKGGKAEFTPDPKPKPSSTMNEQLIVDGSRNTKWIHFETTLVARDKTLTIRLIADGGRVAFDNISLRKVKEKTETKTNKVKLQIGVWDNRQLHQYRIRNKGEDWTKWIDIPYECENKYCYFAQVLPKKKKWELSKTYEVQVQIRDWAGGNMNESNVCSDKISGAGPTPTPTPGPGKSDLIVAKLVIRKPSPDCANSVALSGCAQPGENLCARVVIKNQGDKKAKGSQTGFRKRGGQKVSTKWTKALDPSQSKTENFSFNAPSNPSTYTAKAWADYNKEINESNENNNTKTTTYCVETSPTSPPCWLEGDFNCDGEVDLLDFELFRDIYIEHLE